MLVSSSVGGTIEISRTCPNVEILLGDLKLVAHDLQVMAMRDIDVILRMDIVVRRDKYPYKLREGNPPYTMESREPANRHNLRAPSYHNDEKRASCLSHLLSKRLKLCLLLIHLNVYKTSYKCTSKHNVIIY